MNTQIKQLIMRVSQSHEVSFLETLIAVGVSVAMLKNIKTKMSKKRAEGAIEGG